MKTKNNVQQASKKSVVFILSLVVLSLTLNAQNYRSSILEENVLAMANNHSETSTVSGKMAMNMAYISVESEEELDLEDWMTDETRFDAFSASLITETEDALEIEEWMLDETTFNHSNYQLLIETETEEEMDLEAWMFNESIFESKVEAENELELEAWMTSDGIWNR